MDVKDVINSVAERVKDTADVRVVFGEPIVAENMTIIPVASVKVAGGGGGGIGDQSDEPDEEERGVGKSKKGQGMGLGLKVMATPVGYIEVQGGEARMVDIVDKNKLAVGGMVIGGLLLLTTAKLLAWHLKHR